MNICIMERHVKELVEGYFEKVYKVCIDILNIGDRK